MNKLVHTVGIILSLLLAVALVQAAPPATTRAAKPKRGEILRLEKDTITAMPFLPPMDTERSGAVTYDLDENTRIFIATLIEQRPASNGGRVKSYKTDPASRDNLKVGQRVRIEAEGNKAVRITIWPDEPEQEKAPATTQPHKSTRTNILRVEKDSVTATAVLPEGKAADPVTYTVDERTRIYISLPVKGSTESAGARARTNGLHPASRDDLKAGLVAKIWADGDRATMIILMPDDSQQKKVQQ